MDGAVESLRKEFGGLRTGRANAGLLDGVVVKAYGSEMPINQVASVTVPEARMLTVSVWDKTMVAAVDKALRQSSLGLNPVMDGQNLRIPMPPLTEERRKDLTKVAGTYSENAKVAVRNVRRLEKDGDMGEDEQKSHEKDVQAATDDVIKNIDDTLSQKTDEIMQV
jgi:ribosome recycling factor